MVESSTPSEQQLCIQRVGRGHGDRTHSRRGSTRAIAISSAAQCYAWAPGDGRSQRNFPPALAAVRVFLARVPRVPDPRARAEPPHTAAAAPHPGRDGDLRRQLFLGHVAPPAEQQCPYARTTPYRAAIARRPHRIGARAQPGRWQHLSLAPHRSRRYSWGDAPSAAHSSSSCS